KAVKIGLLSLVIVMILFVFYVNATSKYPAFLQHNKLFNSVTSRLSVNLLLTDPRFYAWSKIDYKILLDKPWLGYGPENFSVGFDKHYDPSTPYLQGDVGWWDRAHNILFQTVSDAGIFALI